MLGMRLISVRAANVRKERAACGASPVQCETTSLLLLDHGSCGVREVTAFERLIRRDLLRRWVGRLGLGRLSGDIGVEHKKFIFHRLLISAVLTLIFWLVVR